MSLDKSAEEWGKKAIEIYSQYGVRRSYVKEITDFGYNIDNVASELEKFYLA